MSALWQDAQYALRGMRRNPGFALIAVLTLALGIGANTAIFSLVNGLMLKALPYPEHDQLVMVWTDNRLIGAHQNPTSYINLADYRSQSRHFQSIAAFSESPVSFSDAEEPVSFPAAFVASDFFSVMKVAPLLGRTIRPEEDKLGAGHVVILSYGFWQRYCAGNTNIIGQTIRLSYRPLTVIGVMPPAFQFPQKAEVWINLPVGYRTSEQYTKRDWTIFQAIGRLRPDAPLQQARTEMTVLASRLEQQYPKENGGYGVTLIPLREQLLGELGPMLWLLFGTVGFVLLTACTNIASLLLARAAARQREMAVRLALGASRTRLIRQLLTESLLLGMLGGMAGLLLAWGGVKLFVATNPFNIWQIDQISIDGRVLAFTLMVSLLTGLLFGLMPAWQASKQEMAEALKEGSLNVTTSRQSHRLRELLVMVEVALALILLVGAGLMIRSFRQLQNVNPGIATERLLTFRVRLPSLIYSDEEKEILFHQQLLERLSVLPGVKAVGASFELFGREVPTQVIEIEGHPLSQTGQVIEVPWDIVSAGYFQMMGIPLRQGRMFTAQDQLKAQPVVIVNEALARRFWPGQDVTGKRIKLPDIMDTEATIVGVVADYLRFGLESEVGPEIYVSDEQHGLWDGQLFIRTNVDPLSLVSPVRQAVRDMDKNLPIWQLQPLEQLMADRLAPRYSSTLLLSLFALIALLLAAMGSYGTLSYQVRQRTHEIGIRVALGAQPRDIIALIVKRGLILALAGLAVGLAGAMALARFAAGLLYGVGPFDLTNLVTVSLVLLAATLLASYLPARRATKIEPVVALRYE